MIFRLSICVFALKNLQDLIHKFSRYPLLRSLDTGNVTEMTMHAAQSGFKPGYSEQDHILQIEIQQEYLKYDKDFNLCFIDI